MGQTVLKMSKLKCSTERTVVKTKARETRTSLPPSSSCQDNCLTFESKGLSSVPFAHHCLGSDSIESLALGPLALKCALFLMVRVGTDKDFSTHGILLLMLTSVPFSLDCSLMLTPSLNLEGIGIHPADLLWSSFSSVFIMTHTFTSSVSGCWKSELLCLLLKLLLCTLISDRASRYPLF